MARLSGEAQLLLKLLDDGQWHPRADIINRLASQIAPGKALRRYDAREANRMSKDGPRRGPELSEVEKIASGQRQLANWAFNSLKKGHRLDLEERDARSWVRRRPAPQPAALPEQDPPQEEPATPTPQEDPPAAPQVEPATPAGPPPDVAFVSESQLRQIVREELHRALTEMAISVEFTNQEKEAVRQVINDSLDDFQRGMETFLTERLAAREDLARVAALRMIAGLPSRAEANPNAG
jgi:hypothetical protein